MKERDVRWWMLMLLACGSPDPGDSPSTAPETSGAPHAVSDAEFVNPELPLPAPGTYAASHVLVTWAGAPKAPKSVERTRDEALRRARILHAHATAPGALFADLAGQASDDPSGARGGSLGPFESGTFDPVFEAAVASIDIGAVAPLIETPYGFHIVRREGVDAVKVRHITFAWDGARGATVARTKDDANTRALEARTKLIEGAAPSAVGADEASADQGTWLARGQWVPAAEGSAFTLQPGEVSPPIETPVGYVVVHRLE